MLIRTVYWLGVDVSKDTLQLHAKLLNFKLPPTIANEPGAIRALFTKLLTCRCLGGRALPRLRLICEPTGGYERPLQEIAWELGLRICAVNPKRVRRYIEGCGTLAKTDAIDARMLCQFGTERDPAALPAPSAAAVELRALTTRRRQLVASLGEHQSQLGKHSLPLIIEGSKLLITIIKEQIALLEKRMREVIRGCPHLRLKMAALQEVKGVGFLTAATVLALVPELGHLNRREAAALLGVAPIPADSGKFKGRRYIQGGRDAARAALYMAALTASRHNDLLKEFYNRLITKGKPTKVALVAVMNKLAKALNSILKKLIPTLPPITN